MVTLRVNQVAFGLRAGVLGASDERMGVWTQGCSISPKCAGCASMHTWSSEAGKELAVATLVRLAKARSRVGGLTISGGEPTDQPGAVAALMGEFRYAFPEAEIVLYTGRAWDEFESRFPALRELADVVVAGPFVRRLPSLPLAGSANQAVKLLTPRAEELYAGSGAWPAHAVQIGGTANGQVVTVGIPQTSAMDRAAQRCAIRRVTWHRGRKEL